MAVFDNDVVNQQGPWLPNRTTHARLTTTVPTTALDSTDEQVLLFQFPTNPFGNEVWLRSVIIDFDDLDSDATPLLTADVGIGDSDGVIDTSLVSGDTSARTGALLVAFDDEDEPIDVSGKFLIWDVTAAAATAAAGDIEVFVGYVGGVDSRTATAEVQS